MAESSGLGPEETGALVSLAARWAALDASALGQEARTALADAQWAPQMPLLGARQLLVPLMREEAVIESLPDDQARDDYIAKNLHGYEQPDSGRTIEQVIAEYERGKAAAGAAAQPSGTAAKIAELYKHPAMMDAKHPEHDAAVQQLLELHSEE